MGRKKLELNADLVRNLTSLMLEKWEILAALECSESAFDKWLKRTFRMGWLDFRRKHATWGKISLMRMAYQQAQQGEWRAIDKLCDVYVWPDHKRKIEVSANAQPVAVLESQNYDALSVEELEQLDQLMDKATVKKIE